MRYHSTTSKSNNAHQSILASFSGGFFPICFVMSIYGGNVRIKLYNNDEFIGMSIRRQAMNNEHFHFDEYLAAVGEKMYTC